MFLLGGAIAELSEAIETPTVGAAIFKDSASVPITDADLFDAAQSADLDRKGACVGGAIAELSVAIIAPTTGNAVRGDRTRRIASCGDLDRSITTRALFTVLIAAAALTAATAMLAVLL